MCWGVSLRQKPEPSEDMQHVHWNTVANHSTFGLMRCWRKLHVWRPSGSCLAGLLCPVDVQRPATLQFHQVCAPRLQRMGSCTQADWCFYYRILVPNHWVTFSKEVEGMGDVARLSCTGRENYIFISQHLELGINQSFPSFFDPFRLLTGFSRFRNKERFCHVSNVFQIVKLNIYT